MKLDWCDRRTHGPAPAAVRVKDVWARTTSTHACCGWGNYSRELAPHDTMFLLLEIRDYCRIRVNHKIRIPRIA